MKIFNKEKAIKLRKEGKSYSEILKVVPVAKSTLSIWLRGVGLSKPQLQRLTNKKLAAAKRGGAVRKLTREKVTEEITRKSVGQIGRISARELFLIGATLYWAEGSKEKDFSPGTGIEFINSDARMLKLFLLWLRNCCKINEEKIHFQIYLHETSKERTHEVVDYWSISLGISKDRLNKIYFKKNNLSPRRRNIGNAYFGSLRIKVRASSSLVRSVAGWVDGITKETGS